MIAPEFWKPVGLVLAYCTYYLPLLYIATWMLLLTWDYAWGKDIKFHRKADEIDFTWQLFIPTKINDAFFHPYTAIAIAFLIGLIFLFLAALGYIIIPVATVYWMLYKFRQHNRKAILVQRSLEG
jgi:hypothetical protein